jgi:ornithine cyclodeaminase/alanine dehydrogenase-like protein (mu-crystallin family)
VTLLLDNDDVARLLSMADCIAALEGGYRDLAAGRAITRPRSDCLAPTMRRDAVYGLKTMDGIVPSAGVAALRLNSDVITWPTRGNTQRREKLPAAAGARWVGLVFLFSTANGEPLAIFPDGVVQRLRVGATNGIGAKLLARDDARTVGLLGSGWQAGAQLMAVTAVRDITGVRCYSPNAANREAFSAEMTATLGIPVTPVSTPEDAVAGADIVMCATNAIEPVFVESWIEPGMHLSAIKRPEIAPAAIARADRVVIHTEVPTPVQSISTELGDVLPKRYRTTDEHDAFSAFPVLTDLVAGRIGGRDSEDAVTCFINNLGLGFQFAAVGAALYARAREEGAGRELPTDWFTETVHP